MHISILQQPFHIFICQRFTLSAGKDLHFIAMVDLPPQFGSLTAYSATLGHKANHRPPHRNNAIYLPYSFHPVLGRYSMMMRRRIFIHETVDRIMSVVALRDIRAGEEVFTNYGYTNEQQYSVRGISLDWFCEKGFCI